MAPSAGFPAVPVLAYEAIREQIHSGDILLCSGSAVFSTLIQHATNSVWSHVGFLLRDTPLERLFVMESVESIGVHAVVLSQYVTNYQGKGRPYPGRLFIARHQAFATVAPTALQRLSQGAVDLWGYTYDQDEILSIAARIVAAKLGMAPHPFRRNNVYICSEYVYECFQTIGIEVPYNPAGYIAPEDFARCADITVLWEIATEEGVP